MKVKCKRCKKTFNDKTHIKALIECLNADCDLKVSTAKKK